MMVSIRALIRTLAGKTVHQNGSIDTSFDLLDSNFKLSIDWKQQKCLAGTWQTKKIFGLVNILHISYTIKCDVYNFFSLFF
jgi:hypothetical protein